MLCFLLPVGLCDRIQSAFTRLWWDSNPTTKKMCWVAWDVLAKLKGEGGLGFRDIHAFQHSNVGKALMEDPHQTKQLACTYPIG